MSRVRFRQCRDRLRFNADSVPWKSPSNAQTDTGRSPQGRTDLVGHGEDANVQGSKGRIYVRVEGSSASHGRKRESHQRQY